MSTRKIKEKLKPSDPLTHKWHTILCCPNVLFARERIAVKRLKMSMVRKLESLCFRENMAFACNLLKFLIALLPWTALLTKYWYGFFFKVVWIFLKVEYSFCKYWILGENKNEAYQLIFKSKTQLNPKTHTSLHDWLLPNPKSDVPSRWKSVTNRDKSDPKFTKFRVTIPGGCFEPPLYPWGAHPADSREFR